jgi:hypothetical protein
VIGTAALRKIAELGCCCSGASKSSGSSSEFVKLFARTLSAAALYSIYVLLAALAHYAKPISQLSYDECINKQALCTCGSDHLLTERTNYRYAGAISVWFLFVAWSRCCLCIVLTRAHTNQHQQQYNHGQTSSVDMEKTSAKAIEV